tara:strand:+ start:1923 stop:2504 length:582 start_codon:yes stop_codon:yes gene_type:complete
MSLPLSSIIVRDNILNDPYFLINLSKKIKYYTNEKTPCSSIPLHLNKTPVKGFYRGYRSDPLHDIDSNYSNVLINEIFTKIFHTDRYSADGALFLTITNSDIFYNDASYPNWWHRDDNLVMAGVIYLSENAPKNSGTLIENNDRDIIEVENIFNRLVLYSSDLIHRPNMHFGNNINNSRLVLTIGISKLNLDI